MIKFKDLVRHSGFRRYFVNTSWMFAIQGVRLIIGFFVSLWVARYLGPEQFGIYSYVNSFLLILLSFSAFGTTDSLVKELVANRTDELRILSSGFFVRACAGITALLAMLLYVYYFERSDRTLSYYFLLCSIPLIFQAFEVSSTSTSSSVLT